MQLESFAQMIEDADLGTLTKTIFINRLPDGIKNAVLLKSRLSGDMMDWEKNGAYFKTSFQAIVRSTEHVAGNELATQINDLFTFETTELEDMYVHYVRPRHLPIPFPRSDGDYYEFSLNFDICFSTD